ncbi:uncharacterized protein LOC118190873 [Stegodyphus dumicola]|uniref:uncharacterized protein LOC118190873 n=1 Tax=Stegodyphus dumicola TaxID=202533 RepID=UPI0015AB96DF|nr:uncharacterized protein LOC118190873 [Stegodyphus dumicola]
MIQSSPLNSRNFLLLVVYIQFFFIGAQRINELEDRNLRRQRVPVQIGEYPEQEHTIRRQNRPEENGDIYEFHRFQHYGFKTPSPHTFSLESMLALLAPLATIPIIASAALSSLATILPTLTTDGMVKGRGKGVVKGRSRREAVLDTLDLMTYFNSSTWDTFSKSPNYPIKRDIRDLDVIQKYLKQMNHKEDYNDEVMASYLQCSGMLSSHNHCLERLVCQFSDRNSRMESLEKDVASLIIYTILNNRHIKAEFKERLRKAAVFGRDSSGRCGFYVCSRNNFRSK